MLKPQVTLFSLIQKWSSIADRNQLVNMIEEMKTMFSEIEEAKISSDDVIKNKDRILGIWIDFSWSECKKRHPTWKEKDWWNRQKVAMIKVWGELYKAMIMAKKPEKVQEVDDSNSFDNVEDMIAWVESHKKRVSNGNE